MQLASRMIYTSRVQKAWGAGRAGAYSSSTLRGITPHRLHWHPAGVMTDGLRHPQQQGGCLSSLLQLQELLLLLLRQRLLLGKHHLLRLALLLLQLLQLLEQSLHACEEVRWWHSVQEGTRSAMPHSRACYAVSQWLCANMQ